MATRRRRKKRNMGMPVVLVNPTKKRKRRSTRRRRRRNPTRRARAGSLARRRNPRVKFKGAAINALLSGLGGIVSYGLHWGSSYAPVGNIGQTAILAGAGTVTAIGTSMLADERAGAGVMGGTIALVAGRVHAQMKYGAMLKKSNGNGANDASGMYGRNAGALNFRQAMRSGAGQIPAYTGRRPEAGVVVPREAGAMMNRAGVVQPARAQTAARMGFAGHQSFKIPQRTIGLREAGASRYVTGPVRWFGPRSWAYNEAGRVYRSAHDVRR